MRKQKILCLTLLFLILFNILMFSGCSSDEKETDPCDYAIIDIHLHLDGSLSVKSVRELAELQGIQIPEDDGELLDLIAVDADCRDLNEYLEKFDFPVSLLQTREAISLSVYNLEKELQELGVLYAEIRFAPQKHTLNGLTQAEVVEAAIEGMNRCDMKSNLILCCMRGDDNREQNEETVRVAKEYLGKGVAAIDIAGAEALFPTEDFADIFELAAQEQIPYTIHAGEAGGPLSVSCAVDFGAARIGHGVRSAEDEALVKRLGDENITLEICPTSNLNTAIYYEYEDVPMLALMEAGVKVTINSDNMTVSNTNVKKEYQKVADAFGLTEEQLRSLAQNAIDASFADSETKSWLTSELEKIGK